MIKRSLLIAGWLVVGYATLNPFVDLQPIPEKDSLDEWQLPEEVAELSAKDRKKVLERLAYTDPAVPYKPLPDFDAISDTTAKKRAFFDYLRPHVRRENNRIRYLREQLLELAEKKRKNQRLSSIDKAFLHSLYDEFRMDVAESDPQMLNELIKRVDILPASLVLMQAANESAWGTSRFAVEGYNFFGQWCFSEGCGLVPLNRGEDKSHEVAKFDTPAKSIRSYFYNLNTFHTYDELREIRAKLRAERKPIRGEVIAGGLGRYSERGDEYIDEISGMIRYNRRFLED